MGFVTQRVTVLKLPKGDLFAVRVAEGGTASSSWLASALRDVP